MCSVAPRPGLSEARSRPSGSAGLEDSRDLGPEPGHGHRAARAADRGATSSNHRCRCSDAEDAPTRLRHGV